MNPITTFNAWILEKVRTYLNLREGCEVTAVEYTSHGAKIELQDSFGFRYELNIKTSSRTNISRKDLDNASS